MDFAYFDFLYSKICRNRYGSVADERICRALCRLPLDVDIFNENPYDSTRLDDIWECRNIYIAENGDWDEDAKGYLSVFEFLVTFCEKIEIVVMANSNYGDRTATWFWMILDNLDITYDTACKMDGTIDLDYISAVIYRWLNKNFCKNGDGSPFPLKKSTDDCRKLSFWEHALRYFTENVVDGESW